MPITSSSAPLRDLVNQYGGNSPQVTRIVAAVNASSFLEGLWNDFAARATSGGGSPVIRVNPLDDNGRANPTGRDAVPADTNADNSRVLLSLDYFRSGPSTSSGVQQSSTDQYGHYDLIAALAHEVQHSNTYDARRGGEQASLMGSGSVTSLATDYANRRTDDELASKVAEYNALKTAGASDAIVAQRINAVLPDGRVLDFFQHIEKVDTGSSPVSADLAISADFRRDFNSQVPSDNPGTNYGALYLADGINQLNYRGRVSAGATLETSIAPQALINGGLHLPNGQNLTLQDTTTGANTQVQTHTNATGSTEFAYTTTADGSAVVVRGTYAPGAGAVLATATAFRDADNLSQGQDVTAQVHGALTAPGTEVGQRGDGLSLVNIGRVATGQTLLNPSAQANTETPALPTGDAASVQAPTSARATVPPEATTADPSDAHFNNHPFQTDTPAPVVAPTAPTQTPVTATSTLGMGEGQPFPPAATGTATNTNELIDLRGGFVPVLRYGNFAGPGYAGGVGVEQLIENPAINGGKPIKGSELCKTPEGLAQFMQLATQTEPNGYMDGVTRNHDVEYTVAEMRFMDSVKTQFDGKLPHELTAQDKQDPTYKQLESARDGEYWQADQRMLTSMAQYQPTDFVDSSYRAIALTAFYNKAESGLFGYGLGPEVKDFYANLKTIDSKISVPTLGNSLGALGTATSLARGDFEALATLPLTPQERQFFNSHLKPGQQLDVSIQNADGNTISYDEKDSTNRIVVPERVSDNVYAVQTKIGGDTVTMILDKANPTNPIFTKEIVHNGEVVSTETIRPTDQAKEGLATVRAYQSETVDGAGKVTSKVIEKPEVPKAEIPPDLQAKIDAVKSGDVAQIVAIPAVHNNNGVDGSDAHLLHYPANTTTGSATPSTTPSTSPPDGSDAHLNHYPPTGNTGAAPVVNVTAGSGTASNGAGATTTSTGTAPSATPDEPQDGDATSTADGSDVHLSHYPADTTTDTTGPDGSDAHFLHHPLNPEFEATPTATRPFNSDLTEDQANTLLTDLGFEPATPSQPGIKLADASTVTGTGTGTVSDAGNGGIGLGNTSTPNASEKNQPVAIVNNGDTAPDSIATTVPDGSDNRFARYPAPPPNLVPLTDNLTLVNTLIGLGNWGKQSDLSHLSTAVNLYNSVTRVAGVSGPLGDLGSFGAGLGVITALKSGNPIVVASAGASFANAVSTTNVVPIPVINALNLISAIQSGNALSIASSAVAFIPVYGPLLSIGLSVFGALVGGHSGPPPPPDGSVHYTWDETGAITIQTDHNVSGGGDTAHGTASNVLGLVQSLIASNNDDNTAKGHADANLAIDPSRMPRIGFTAGMSWLEITNPDGSTTKQAIDPDNAADQILRAAVVSDAVVPVWQIQTAQAHAKAEHAAQIEAQAQATTGEPAHESATAIDGQAPVAATATSHADPIHNTAIFGVEGKASESTDHQSQTYEALVVHLHNPQAQAHMDALAASATPDNANDATTTSGTHEVLRDVDGDGYFESTQWVDAKDAHGNTQGLLVLDRNHDGLIATTDILHVGGNSDEHNSLAWLDANADGKLDASDPAFAAIKLWVDCNNNGRVDDGEESSLQDVQLGSIDFTTGQVNYTNGQSDALTATTLKSDTEGIKLDHIKVVGEDGKLQELKEGSVLIHEGYQGQVRVNSRGEIVADDDPGTDTHLVSQRINSYEFNAAHLSDWEGKADQDQHRHGGTNINGAPTETSVTGISSMGPVLGKDNVKTTTTVDVGDKRLVSDAPKTQAPSDTAPNNTTITLNAGDARIRSLTPAENALRVVFVPSGVRDGWMTADGKELLQLPDDGLFGTGGMAGALMAVALGAVQSTAFAKADANDTGFTWQTTPLMLNGAGANSNHLNVNTDAANAGNDSASTIALGNYATVHRVRLGVRLSAAPLADAPAASYTTADTGTARTSNTQTPTTATNYASANPTALDANTGPTQTLIDNQPPPKAKTPATTTTPPADPTSNTESTAPSNPTTSTTNPATPTPTATTPPPNPTLVATPPTAPAAVTPTTANDQLSNPLEDSALHVSFATLMANDLNASSITAVGNATHGSVAIVGGEVVFTPSQNYHGPASFVYQVVSTDGNFALGQADFDISGVNDVPEVLGETASANEDIALVLSQTTLLANDTDVDVATDGQTLSVSAVGNASHGTVSLLGNGSVQFNPDANFHGTASFKYVVSDGHGGSATATATVQVAAVNDVPVVLGEVISSAEDTTLLISQAALLADDTDADVATDGQTLSVSAVSNATHGTVTLLGNGQVQFIPTANYAGTASFDYVVSDGHGGTATTTATVLVGSTDDAPVASGEAVNSLEDQSVVLTAAALLANETDIDNTVSSLSISRVTGGAGGSAVLNASGNVVFTPNANFSGTASFTYWVKDPDGMESNPATVTLNVAPVNDSPYAQGEVLSGASEDAVFNIDRMALLGNDGDEEDNNSSLGIELVGNASSGTVAMGAGGNVVFTPTANYNGNVSFQYQVRDTAGALSPTVTAQFNVAAVNDTPLGVDETLTPMYTNTAASPSTATVGFNTLLINDSDVDNPHTDLTVSGVRNASNGTVSIVAGAVSFTPTLNFNGTASFEYQVDDQHGGQTWATAFIAVAPPPNLYPSINVTLANFYPTGTTPAGAFDIGDLQWTIADDGNTGLVSVTYLSGSYHVFGDPGPAQASLPWNIFTTTQTSWYVDVPRAYAVDSFTTTWRVVDDRGLANTWHFNYTVGSGYQSVMDFTGYAPPVVLGLYGDSPHYIETQYSNVRYDLNGDGVADQVAWAAPGSGVLGIDLNGDQRISDANEFAFSHYVPGAKTDLEGLRAFDSNHNGALDAGDAQWAQFGVWEDKNSDGQTDAGEYQTLDALGISNINLNGHTPTQAQDEPSDGHLTGVAVVGESTFTRTDGSTGQVDDAMLAFTAPPKVAPYSHEAEVMRMALLFNQMCNTASDGDHAALGYVPIQTQTDGHWQDAVVAVPQGALQESFN